LMLPYGCASSSGTCREVARELNIDAFTESVSHKLHSPHISQIVDGVSRTPGAIGVVPRMFTNGISSIRILPVDGIEALAKRGLWAYLPVKLSEGGIQVVDRPFAACLLDAETVQKVNASIGGRPVLDANAIALQRGLLLGSGGLARHAYEQRRLSVEGGDLFSISRRDSDGAAILKNSSEP
jgi:hypothetical protein